MSSSKASSVAVGNCYESLEQLLTTVSPKYNEAFSKRLEDKLQELEKAQNDDSEKNSPGTSTNLQ